MSAPASSIPLPLQPAVLPEFGNLEVGWAMCRNSRCVNFCVLYGASIGYGEDDPRYKLRRAGAQLKIRCRACSSESTLYAPPSIRPIARYFLSQSLPFAACRDEACANYGINVFDHYRRGTRRDRSPYRRVGGDNRDVQLRCNECEKVVTLGAAPGLTDEPVVRENVHALIHSVALGRPVTDAFESGMNIATYYRRLERVGAVLRDRISYWNAHLLQEGFCDQSERTLKIYTDVIQVSLRKLGVGPTRIQHLGVIVSVVSLGQTYYVLAAHPYFLPAELCPDLTVLEEDQEIPSQLLERKWDGVVTLLDDGPTITDDGEFVPQLADEGLKGHMVRPRFGAVAHFLVVQKMLSRFKRLCFYVDTASELNSSALVAMREAVRNNRVEVVLFQYSKSLTELRKLLRQGARVEPTEAHWQGEWNKVAANLEKSADKVLEDDPTMTRARARARAWRPAVQGAKGPGRELWFDFPPPFDPYPHCRTLWLTRQPTQTREDGRDFLFAATLQPVDSTHSSMRARINPFEHLDEASVGRRAVRDAGYLPGPAIDALSVYMIYRNFRRWRRDDIDKVLPAAAMGLMGKTDPQAVPWDIFWEFRLDVDHALEISRWMAA